MFFSAMVGLQTFYDFIYMSFKSRQYRKQILLYILGMFLPTYMIEIFFFMAIDILKDVGPITYNSFEMLAIGSPIATILYGAWIFLIKWRIKQTINVVEQKAFSILYVIIFIPCAILLCISNTFKVFSFNIWGGGLDDQHARLFIV